MSTTARLAIPYPALSDAADVPNWMSQMATRLDTIAAMYVQGTIASRPAAGTAGRFFISTDENPKVVYYDTGSAWISVGSVPDGSITQAKIADGAITTSKYADASITAVKLAAALKPSGGAAAGTEALRALGSTAGTAAAGDDARIPTYGAAFPGSATLGQRFALEAQGRMWDFIYRPNIDATYPWQFVGGPPLHSASSGGIVQITIPRNGVYHVFVVVAASSSSGTNFDISGLGSFFIALNGSVSITNEYGPIDGEGTYAAGNVVSANTTSGAASRISMSITPVKCS